MGTFFILFLLLTTNVACASGMKSASVESSQKSGIIIGTVIPTEKNLLREVYIYLFKGSFDDTSKFVSHTSPDSTARFEFKSLSPGLYNVGISGMKIEGDAVFDVRVASDSASIVTFRVEPRDFWNIEPFPSHKVWKEIIVPIIESIPKK